MRRRLRDILMVAGISLTFGGAILLVIYSLCGLLSLLYEVLIGG